ncbi:MAG: hypothetical protein V4584_00010 [Verrucomicrobiota bacterium]
MTPHKSGFYCYWLAVAGLVGILGVAAIRWPRWTSRHDLSMNVRQSILINEAKAHELGIVLYEITHPDGVVIVPAEAILEDQVGTFALVQDDDRKDRFLRASVVAESTGVSEKRILRGLFTGDEIVVNGASRLRVEPSIKPTAPSTNCD